MRAGRTAAKAVVERTLTQTRRNVEAPISEHPLLLAHPDADAETRAKLTAAIERDVQPAIVGRGRDATVRVEDPTLEAEHLRLTVDERGEATVEAQAPSLLNGVQLSGASAIRSRRSPHKGGAIRRSG